MGRNFIFLKFTDNSLQFNQVKTNNDGVTTGNVFFRETDLGKLTPDLIEIKLDRVYNRIMIEYMLYIKSHLKGEMAVTLFYILHSLIAFGGK